jgi:hypothetical protein
VLLAKCALGDKQSIRLLSLAVHCAKSVQLVDFRASSGPSSEAVKP